jgi:hypothetical protein
VVLAEDVLWMAKLSGFVVARVDVK